MPELLRVMKIIDFTTYTIYRSIFGAAGCYLLPLTEIKDCYVVIGDLKDDIDNHHANDRLCWVETWYIEDYFTLGPIGTDHFQTATRKV